LQKKKKTFNLGKGNKQQQERQRVGREGVGQRKSPPADGDTLRDVVRSNVWLANSLRLKGKKSETKSERKENIMPA